MSRGPEVPTPDLACDGCAGAANAPGLRSEGGGAAQLPKGERGGRGCELTALVGASRSVGRRDRRRHRGCWASARCAAGLGVHSVGAGRGSAHHGQGPIAARVGRRRAVPSGLSAAQPQCRTGCCTNALISSSVSTGSPRGAPATGVRGIAVSEGGPGWRAGRGFGRAHTRMAGICGRSRGARAARSSTPPAALRARRLLPAPAALEHTSVSAREDGRITPPTRRSRWGESAVTRR